jgi:hypothetical protein
MSCQRCQMTPGWILTERGGMSGVEPCPCSVKPWFEARKAATREIARVFAKIAASKVVPFFPETEEGAAMLASEASNYVEDVAKLDLFARAILRLAKKYEGPLQLRIIYCTVGEPADGFWPSMKELQAVGFDWEQCEARHKMAEVAAREKQEEEFRRLAQGQAPFALPEVKRIA